MPMSPRLLRPRSSAVFNPRQISGLAGWWDFDDAATVTVATGISAVTDKSGNVRTLSQSTTNNRPAWTANSINGKYAAVFDGSNDALTASFTLAQPVTAFLVARWNDVNSGTMMDGATGNTMRLFRTAANNYAMFAGTQLTSTNTTPATYAVHECLFNGTASELVRNGTNIGASSSAGTSSPGGIYLGTFGNGFSDPAKVDIANVVLYSRVLSASERSAVRKWLGGLYAITVV